MHAKFLVALAASYAVAVPFYIGGLVASIPVVGDIVVVNTSTNATVAAGTPFDGNLLPAATASVGSNAEVFLGADLWPTTTTTSTAGTATASVNSGPLGPASLAGGSSTQHVNLINPFTIDSTGLLPVSTDLSNVVALPSVIPSLTSAIVLNVARQATLPTNSSSPAAFSSILNFPSIAVISPPVITTIVSTILSVALPPTAASSPAALSAAAPPDLTSIVFAPNSAQPFVMALPNPVISHQAGPSATAFAAASDRSMSSMINGVPALWSLHYAAITTSAAVLPTTQVGDLPKRSGLGATANWPFVLVSVYNRIESLLTDGAEHHDP